MRCSDRERGMAPFGIAAARGSSRGISLPRTPRPSRAGRARTPPCAWRGSCSAASASRRSAARGAGVGGWGPQSWSGSGGSRSCADALHPGLCPWAHLPGCAFRHVAAFPEGGLAHCASRMLLFELRFEHPSSCTCSCAFVLRTAEFTRTPVACELIVTTTGLAAGRRCVFVGNHKYWEAGWLSDVLIAMFRFCATLGVSAGRSLRSDSFADIVYKR